MYSSHRITRGHGESTLEVVVVYEHEGSVWERPTNCPDAEVLPDISRLNVFESYAWTPGASATLTDSDDSKEDLSATSALEAFNETRKKLSEHTSDAPTRKLKLQILSTKKKMAAFVKTIAGFMFSVIRRTRNCSKTYSHEHLMRCEECERLKFVIKHIEEKIQIKCNNSSMTERRGDMLYDLKQAEKDIFEWKAHIMRSTNQEKGKQDVIQQLDENTILVIMDWAMKFQP
ncbi:hypothetical protein AWC38_SpisGene1031 [Stylophora pistillata]|uniref:Uncharacterized protein n=1 Tax=Stylophora pistillata TaxID=50429 RepID=A0A2B4T032_STYPI|nr:hypothetical protein AWC38_SpisGene1031 [Stylophora pistillata]